MLLTYDIRIRNTDPCFHLVSCYKKHFLVSNEKCCFLYVGCYCMALIKQNQCYIEATAGEGSGGCARDFSSHGKTLKEGNVNLSIDYHTPFFKKPFQRAQQYSHLTLQDFKINEVEKTLLDYLSSVLFEYSVQCNIMQSSLSEEAVFFSNFLVSFTVFMK